MKEQEGILKKLEKVYHEVECRKIELELGIGHLKEIQTRLANGDVRARAQIMGGDLGTGYWLESHGRSNDALRTQSKVCTKVSASGK